MSEFRDQLSRIVEAALACQFGDRRSCDKFDSQLESAKALLARPEPDIEDEVNEGVWQLKLEGDRQDAAVFEAFGSFEPAAAEKAREWNNEAEQLELLADRLTWPQPIRQDLDLAEAAIREYIKLRFYVPSPPAATGE